MFKTETHLHTKETSVCGQLSALEMVESYREAGYHTIIVTDHFYKPFFTRGEFKNWREGVDKFLEGYRAVAEATEKYGMSAILGAEVELTENKNHYLIYGDVESFLYKHEDLFSYSIEELYRLAVEDGVLVIQAHALRDGKCHPVSSFVDGFEVYNSNPRHEDFSVEVERLARLEGKITTSGSDAHRLCDVALGGIESERKIDTYQDLINLLRSGEYGLIRGAGKVYLCADPHGCELECITDYIRMAGEEDLLIILGDLHFGFDGDTEAAEYNESVITSGKNIAIIDGNHDNQYALWSYPKEKWCGGIVNRINEHTVYLRRGEIYEIKGKRIFTFGGCQSSTKWRDSGRPVYDSERPTKEELCYAKERLAAYGNQVDFILTHKCEDGHSGTITDVLFDLTSYIEENVAYKRWFTGHLHIDRERDEKHTVVYKRLRELI